MADNDILDIRMYEKGYRYKLVPLGKYENLDSLYAKTAEQAKDLRVNPPEVDMQFKVEIL